MVAWAIALAWYTKRLKNGLYKSYYTLNKNMDTAVFNSLQIVSSNQIQFFGPIQTFLNNLIDFYANNYIEGVKELIKACDNFENCRFEDIKSLADNLTKICVDAEIGRSEHKHFIDVQVKSKMMEIKAEMEQLCPKKPT